MTLSPSDQFARELELFRREVEGATQFFYGYLAVNAAASKRKKVLVALNTAPLFWKTSIAAMQIAAVIALGRIFDQGSNHNLDRLIAFAQRNRFIFDKQALGARKIAQNPNAPNPPPWLVGYLQKAYVPTPSDFRRLKRYIKARRSIYDASIRDMRNKLYAHREISDQAGIDALFGKTRIRDLERLFIFLNQLYEALWECFYNGRRPVLRARRYAVGRIWAARREAFRQKGVHQTVVYDVRDFFDKYVP